MKKIYLILLLTPLMALASQEAPQQVESDPVEVAIKNLDLEEVKRLVNSTEVSDDRRRILVDIAERMVDDKQARRFLQKSGPDLKKFILGALGLYASLIIFGFSAVHLLEQLYIKFRVKKVTGADFSNTTKFTETKDSHDKFKYLKIVGSIGGLALSPKAIYETWKIAKSGWNLDHANSEYEKARAILNLIRQINE